MAAMARCLALLLAAALLMSMADAQAAEWLAAHNSARAAVGVAPLVWNTTVYNAALAYANSQRTRCLPLTHSGNPEYGENLAYSSYPSTTPTSIVRDGWVGSEKPYYNYATNTCSAPAGRSCSHYTQVVWADTTSVGCAKVTCTNGIFYFVCNYYPPGNYIGEKPY